MKYIKEFDALRAFAVIAVMFQHYLGQYKVLSVFGSSGVTLFFVLSGFLITQILMKEKQQLNNENNPRKLKIGKVLKIFYIRRSLRIFPIYYIMLIVLVALNIDSARSCWNFHFFYLSNILYSFHTSLDRLGHFWSLAVEEQFYLIWPFIVLLLPVKINRMQFFSLLIAVSLGFKAVMIFVYPQTYAYVYLMPSCIEAFATGAIVVELINKPIAPQKLIIGMAVSLALFTCLQLLPVIYPASISGVINKLFSRTLFSACAAMLLLMIIQGVAMGLFRRLLVWKPLVHLGKISYGIYIYHVFVPGTLIYLQQKFHFSLKGSGINFISLFLVSFTLAHLSFILIERPIGKLKSRFVY